MKDSDGLVAIAGIVEGLGIFQEVWIAGRQPRGLNAGSHPCCWIQPRRATEVDGIAEEVPERTRTVKLWIHLYGRAGGEDLEELQAVVDLADAIAAALEGQSLGDQCIPRLTRVESLEYLPEYPEADVTLAGTFTYLPDSTVDAPADPPP